MRKAILLSTLLLMACFAQAQTLKVSPTMKKGDVKNYKTTVAMQVPGKEVNVTSTLKYTVTEETADGYVVDCVTTDFTVDNSNDAMGRLLMASDEVFNGINCRFLTDKDGRVTGVKNMDEVKAKCLQTTDNLIAELFKAMPELESMMPKETLKKQFEDVLTESAIVKGTLQSASVTALNGKTITLGAQDEVENSQGMKMKRMYFINGKDKITATSTLNMTRDDMKKMILEKVEQMAPAQANMIKENIDMVLDSGMMKFEGTEKANYELDADGWMKTVTVESNTSTMGQNITVNTTITRQ